jgi:hypothetical protein
MGSSIEQIRMEILNNPNLEKEARKLAKQVLQETKKQLIDEFNNHPVTKEIEGGPSASNDSGTLGGKGNLFSFIGFDDGDSPTLPVKNLLNNIELSSVRSRLSGDVLQFKVNMPDQSQLEAASKMPWESGRSWLFDMERTISGLGEYLYGVFKKSRSGTGVQVDGKLLNAKVFRPVKYLNTMLENFSKKLKGV